MLDKFLTSRHPSAKKCIGIVRRNSYLVTPGIERVNVSRILYNFIETLPRYLRCVSEWQVNGEKDEDH